MRDADFDETKFEPVPTSPMHSFSKESANNSSNEPPLGSSTSKRHYSSQSCWHSNMFLFPKIEPSYYCRLKNLKTVKHFHSTCISNALSSEELAKLAKLKQMRKSQDKSKIVYKTQTLNPQSRERKVPSSRIGRLSSFGGKLLFVSLHSVSLNIFYLLSE